MGKKKTGDKKSCCCARNGLGRCRQLSSWLMQGGESGLTRRGLLHVIDGDHECNPPLDKATIDKPSYIR